MTDYNTIISSSITNTVRLTGMDRPGSEAEITEVLRNLDGVVDMDIAARMNRVTITYDVQRIKMQDIEAALVGLGFPLDDSLAAKMLRDLHYYFEENEEDAVNLSTHSCYEFLADKYKPG